MLPIIMFNLVQHLVAGVVAFLLGRSPADQEAPSADTEVGSADSNRGRVMVGEETMPRWLRLMEDKK
jgi:hypothetical protein